MGFFHLADEEREYGYLFYDNLNKESFDSNHALIYREKVNDLYHVLDDIIAFYLEKNIL